MPDQLTMQLVAWCSRCNWWLPPDEIGTVCPGDECERKLLKRRRYVCPLCTHSAAKLSDLKDHECEGSP